MASLNWLQGFFNISGAQWLVDDSGKPTLVAQLVGLVLIISASCLSAMSGLKKGIKWLSNINMGLSVFVIAFFAIFGATFFASANFFLCYLGLSSGNAGHVDHRMVRRRRRSCVRTAELAGRLEHFLLGLVDRLSHPLLDCF